MRIDRSSVKEHFSSNDAQVFNLLLKFSQGFLEEMASRWVQRLILLGELYFCLLSVML